MKFINKYFDPGYFSRLVSSIRIEEALRRGTSLLEESAEVLLHVLAWLLTLITFCSSLSTIPRS